MEKRQSKFPEVPSLELIAGRLPKIFPQGTEYRSYLTREMAAKTIYVMFYAGAIEGTDRWIRPSQVTDMTDKQALLIDVKSREAWVKMMLSSKKKKPENPWYAANSRESVRDETIRTGLIPLQAVVVRQGIPTTSSKPTYALQNDFSALFSTRLYGDCLDTEIDRWQKKHLSKTAISRLKLIKYYGSEDSESVKIKVPDESIRTLAPGPSSRLSKAVIEVFAQKFLKNPKVIWLSGSEKKVATQDLEKAKNLGFNIDPLRALPDIILLDLGKDSSGSDMLVIFTEVVASDGPIHRQRKETLTAIATEAGFDSNHLAFLTVFLDRSSQPFKKSIAELAWGSYAWLATEPDYIIGLRKPVNTLTALKDGDSDAALSRKGR